MPQHRSSTRASVRRKMRAKFSRGAPPPHTIERKRKRVIQKIVARRNAAEHFAHARGCFALVRARLGRVPGSVTVFLLLPCFGHRRTLRRHAGFDCPSRSTATPRRCAIQISARGERPTPLSRCGAEAPRDRPPRAFLSPARMGAIAPRVFRRATAAAPRSRSGA